MMNTFSFISDGKNPVPYLINQSKEFEVHVSRMKTQFEQIRLLKEKLPLHHVVIHMDFTKNDSCKSL